MRCGGVYRGCSRRVGPAAAGERTVIRWKRVAPLVIWTGGRRRGPRRIPFDPQARHRGRGHRVAGGGRRRHCRRPQSAAPGPGLLRRGAHPPAPRDADGQRRAEPVRRAHRRRGDRRLAALRRLGVRRGPHPGRGRPIGSGPHEGSRGAVLPLGIDDRRRPPGGRHPPRYQALQHHLLPARARPHRLRHRHGRRGRAPDQHRPRLGDRRLHGSRTARGAPAEPPQRLVGVVRDPAVLRHGQAPFRQRGHEGHHPARHAGRAGSGGLEPADRCRPGRGPGNRAGRAALALPGRRGPHGRRGVGARRARLRERQLGGTAQHRGAHGPAVLGPTGDRGAPPMGRGVRPPARRRGAASRRRPAGDGRRRSGRLRRRRGGGRWGGPVGVGRGQPLLASARGQGRGGGRLRERGSRRRGHRGLPPFGFRRGLR